MDQQILENIKSTQLMLDQTTTPIQIDPSEIVNFYDPLAVRLHNFSLGKKRLMVAVAGPPGSGKSVFAALLVVVINAEAGFEEAIQIQQDGWHYPNQYLDTHTFQTVDGEEPLRKIKGAPETYDTTSAYTLLKRIRQGNKVSFPVYSRKLHDPVPDAGVVESKNKIVIIEGNYWLLQEPPWDQFQELFDVSIFLSASPATLLNGLRQRQIRGGRSAQVAEQQVLNVDLPNIEYVIKNSGKPNIVVHKADSLRILRVEDQFQWLST